MSTLVSQDPMWVYFDMDEPTALKCRELARQGKFGPTNQSTGVPVAKIPFGLRLANDKGFRIMKPPSILSTTSSTRGPPPS